MKRILKKLVHAVAALALAGPALAQPANDGCAGATPVIDGDNAISNTNATFDTANPCSTDPALGDVLPPYNADVWYSYTAPATGLRNIETTNDPYGGLGYALAIYDTCGGTMLACNHIGIWNGFSKIYHFPVTEGVTYRIQVAGFFGAVGGGTLKISEPTAASATPGDDCATAIPVVGATTSAPFNTAGMTGLDVQAWDTNIPSDAWFAWTPGANGIGYVTACGYASVPVTPSTTMRISVYDACGAVPLTTNLGPFWETSTSTSGCIPTTCFEAIAGQTYYVRYGGGTVQGTMQFEIRQRNGFAIPAGAIAEPGNCTDTAAADANGGCYVTPPAYTTVNLCERRTGTASSRKDTFSPLQTPAILSRDEDWYVLTLDVDQTITITGQSEFPPLARLMATCSTDPFGTGGVIIRSTAFRADCSGVFDLNRSGTPGSYAPFTANLVSGTYYFVVSPIDGGYASSLCGHGDRYWFTITGADPCPPTNENCCRGTTCNSIAAGSCTGTVAGSASVTVASCGSGAGLASCCYADFNHDGTQSIDDLFLYFNAYFTGSPWANYGGDGVETPTIDDLFLYINAYFTGCS